MKKNISNLAGNNIYLDVYGNKVYYNIFNKNGYVISKNNEQKFRVFYYRYSIIFMLLILLGDYFNTLQNTLIFGAGLIILSELYFRTFFLNKLKVIKNFKRDKKVSVLEQTIKSKEKEKTIMKACAYILLSVLIIINAIQQNFNIVFLIVSVLLSIFSLYSGIINMVAFIKMKKLYI
ncbi:hypothetical protein JCM1393_13010 [Clostridium carnis]